jgi:DNA-binding FrmR family transcriptional regulator
MATTKTHTHERVQEQVAKRLARAEGHLRAVTRMWQEGKPCPEVLLQVSAVQAALRQVSRIIVEEHMESCLVEAAGRGSSDQALAELKDALKRLL